ncbi:MAG: VWA domain-containing protein [Bacteroidetes bacterium]|nr:VWA domain-containing protein [Bacteroidota bacterium]
MPRSFLSLLILTALVCAPLAAQPVLKVKRAVVQWPDVHVFYDISCNGIFQPYHPATNLTLDEDGIPIGSFTTDCPDTTQHCPMSVGLVFDMSNSTIGQFSAAQYRSAQAFVGKMDGVTDEAEVLFFNQQVSVQTSMTTQKSTLMNAFNNFIPSGGSAIYDGIYTGVSEVISNANNNCKVVVVACDGSDNQSSKTPDDIIVLARSNRVRVITIGFGGAHHPVPLQRIADSTGGLYFGTSDTLQLPNIYREIYEFISDGFRECELVYRADCADGAYHELTLAASNLCGGAAKDSLFFLKPLIPNNMTDIDLHPNSTVAFPGDLIDVPVVNLSAPGVSGVLHPFDLAFGFERHLLELQDVIIPPASPLTATTVSVIPFAGNFLITSRDAVSIQGNGPFFTLRFRVLQRQDSVIATIRQVLSDVDKGCLKLKLHDGQVVISIPPNPVIEALGPASFCAGDSVSLRVTEEFDTYRWTTGDTTRSIVVKNDGAYAVNVMDYAGRTASSPAFFVTVFPGADPHLSPSDTLSLCAGSDVTVQTMQHYLRYAWSTGDTTATVTIADAGSYWVQVVDSNGCAGISDTLVVILDDPIVTITPSAPQILCEGDTLWLEASAGFASYRWSHGISGRFAAVTKGGTYTVRATNAAGCTAVSDVITVSQLSRPVAVISALGPLSICPGDSLRLEASDGHAGYSWSTGAVTRSIVVRKPGIYRLTVIDANGCRSLPDSVVVAVPARPTLQPGGVHTICYGDDLTIDAGTGYTHYHWSTGDSTQTIQADVSGAFWVDATDVNGCVLRSDTVTVIERPEIRPVIDVNGSATICEGDSVILEAPLGFRGYHWSSGETVSRIVVSRAGKYTVTVFTNEGCSGTSEAVEITVVPRPPKPIVTRQGSTLTASTAHAYQWHRDGVPISGATSRTHEARLNGMYHVVVYNAEGCGSASDPVEVVVSGVHVLAEQFRVEVYPDPSDGIITVRTVLPSPETLHITVLNILGQSVAEIRERQQQGSVTRSIDLSHAPSGVYLLRVRAGETVHTRRIVRQ